jgi:uncharacterized protein
MMPSFRSKAAQASPLLVAAALMFPIWSAAGPAAAQGADCRRASGPVETAICSTPALARLDAQIAQRYAAAMAELDAQGAQALRRDQRAFLAARDEAGATQTGSALVQTLTETLSDRLAFFDSFRIDPLVTLIGRWRNLNGEVVINQWATGVLTIEAQTANHNRSGWTCEANASGEWIEEYEARFDDISGAAWGLNVKAEGMTLVVEEDLSNSAGSPPYCGSGGSIAGTYFQAERLPDPSR